MTHLYEDKQGIIHVCNLHMIHGNVFLVTSLCGKDVPANNSFKSDEKPTCKACIRIISISEKCDKEIYDCPIHGKLDGINECPLC